MIINPERFIASNSKKNQYDASKHMILNIMSVIC